MRKKSILNKLILLISMLASMQLAAGDVVFNLADTTFKLENSTIQKGPSFFKLHAKVSQAKMPVDDGDMKIMLSFHDTVTGGEQLCTEHLRQRNSEGELVDAIRVKNGLLNVEFGRSAECTGGKTLEDVIVEKPELFIQININNGDAPEYEPIEPRIQFGTVPYAVKSNFSVHANDALVCETSAQSAYTHRAAADADLYFANGGVMKNGYFDFETVEGFTGGYFAWAPVSGDDNANSIHICRDPRTTLGGSTQLKNLTLDSELTTMTGNNYVERNLTVKENTNIYGELEVSGNATMDSNLEVTQTALIEGKLTVYSDAAISKNVTVGGRLNVAGAGFFDSSVGIEQSLHVYDNVDVDGHLNIGSAANIGGALTVHSDTTMRRNLVVDKNIDVGDELFVGAGVSVSGETSLQNLSVNGNITVGDGTSTSAYRINGVCKYAEALLGDTTVTSASIQDDAVTSSKIMDGQVFSADIANGTVISADVADGALTGVDIKDGTIAGVDIQDGSIGSADIADTAVTSADIRDGSITGTDIRDSSISGVDIVDKTIKGNDIANSTIYGSHIANGTISSLDIKDRTVGSIEIATGAITNEHIYKDAVKGYQIVDGTIQGVDIQGNSITGAHIKPRTITSSDIKSGTITGNEINSQTIIRAKEFRPEGTSGDWAIRKSGENLQIFEPEQSDKVWAEFVDDDKLHLKGTPNLEVDGNLKVKGKITTNISTFNLINWVDNYKSQTLGKFTFCALSKVVGKDERETECSVYKSGSNWYLKANDAKCQATCF